MHDAVLGLNRVYIKSIGTKLCDGSKLRMILRVGTKVIDVDFSENFDIFLNQK
jgi:hypothetical protein